MKLIFKTVKRVCLRCKKEYLDNTGCVLCDECIKRDENERKILGK